MEIKNFYLNIEGEKIFYTSVPLEDDGSIQERWINKDFILSNSPEIIDISHLDYAVSRYSVWNGTDFIAREGENNLPQNCKIGCVAGCVTFAFVKENICYATSSLCIGIGENDMMIAALSSNPTITYEIVES